MAVDVTVPVGVPPSSRPPMPLPPVALLGCRWQGRPGDAVRVEPPAQGLDVGWQVAQDGGIDDERSLGEHRPEPLHPGVRELLPFAGGQVEPRGAGHRTGGLLLTGRRELLGEQVQPVLRPHHDPVIGRREWIDRELGPGVGVRIEEQVGDTHMVVGLRQH